MKPFGLSFRTISGFGSSYQRMESKALPSGMQLEGTARSCNLVTRFHLVLVDIIRLARAVCVKGYWTMKTRN